MDIVYLLGQLAVSSPPLLAAFLLGVITSVSPCPLGSNIAAVAFLSRDTKSHRNLAVVSLAYSAGRSVTYMLFAALAGFATAAASQFFMPLQSHYNLFLSVILLIAGLLLFGKIKLNFEIISAGKLKFLANRGIFGAFLIGAGFAMLFCPISAALFLGGIVPLVLSTKDWFFIPIAYGLGTAIPVLVLPQIIHITKKAGKNSLGRMSKKLSTILGVIFIIAAAYYLLSWLRIF